MSRSVQQEFREREVQRARRKTFTEITLTSPELKKDGKPQNEMAYKNDRLGETHSDTLCLMSLDFSTNTIF